MKQKVATVRYDITKMEQNKNFIISVKGNFLIDKISQDLQKHFVDMSGQRTYQNRVFSGTDEELGFVLDEMGKDETFYKCIGVKEIPESGKLLN